MCIFVDFLVCVMLDFVFIICLGWLFVSVGYLWNYENWVIIDFKKFIIWILNYELM